MVELERLKVSLTKNGYLKLAELVKRHPRWDILENCEGVHEDVNIKRCQVARILSIDPSTDEVPEVWDEIREFGDRAVECFTLLAVIFSHHRLIELFQQSNQGAYRGHIDRDDLPIKEFTNLRFSLSELDLCSYEKGAQGVNYDFRRLIHTLRGAGPIVGRLLKIKLRDSGWIDPESRLGSPDVGFEDQVRRLGFASVLGMEPDEFLRWLNGDWTDAVEVPEQRNRPNRPR